MSALPRITYFALPGRAESSRLCFHIGGKPFENVVVDRTSWPALKPKTPFGQLPILEVDGKMLAQSGAIVRYAAKVNGLYPEDPWDVALAEQAYAQAHDMFEPFGPTMQLPEAEKIAARQALMVGKVGEKLKGLDKLLEGREWVASKLSFADVELFCLASTLMSGFLDGVPKDSLSGYPNLTALRNRVATLPAVKAHYEKETDAIRVAFRPDA